MIPIMKNIKKILLLCVFVVLVQYDLYAQRDTEFWFAVPNIVSGTGSHSDNHMKLCLISYDELTTVKISQPAADPSQFSYFSPITVQIMPNQLYTVNLTPYKSQLKDNTGLLKPYGLYIEADHEIMAYFINTSDDCEAYTLKGQNALGTEFIVPMQYDYKNSYSGHNWIEIVATEDNTDVEIQLPSGITTNAINVDAQNKVHVTMQRGWIYSIRSMSDEGRYHLQNTVITSNKPIAVNSTDDGVEPGDLMGDQILPVSMLGTKYIAVNNYGGSDDKDNFNYLYFFASEDDTHISVYSGSTNGVIEKQYTLNRGEFGPKVSRYAFSQKKADQKWKAVYIESDKPIVVFQMTGVEPAGAILPQLECTGSTEVSFQSVLDKVWADILVKADYIDGFLVNNDATVLTIADFDTVPGTYGRWYYAKKQFTAGSVLRVKNTKGYFHLGMYDMRGNSSSLAYFSDFKGAQLSAASSVPYYMAGDTLRLGLYDALSYTDVVWQCPDGRVITGNPLEIYPVKESDAGMYTVSATHVDGCTINSDAYVVANVFRSSHTYEENCKNEQITITSSDGSTTQTVTPQDTTDYELSSKRTGQNIIVDTVNNARVSNAEVQVGRSVYSIQQDVNVGTQYELSCRMRITPGTTSAAMLNFGIRGQKIGQTITATSQWTTYRQVWQGGVSTKVLFSIDADQQSPAGAYVDIEEIRMSEIFEVPDTVTVNVRPLPEPQISGDEYLCENKAVIEAEDGYSSYQWKKVGSAAVLSESRSLQVNEPGLYEITVIDAEGICTGKATKRIDNGISIQGTTRAVPQICSDETDFMISYSVTAGELGKVSVSYSADARTAGFADVDSLEFDESEIIVPLPEKVRPGQYEAQLTLYGVSYCGGRQIISVPFTINYASASVMQQKWDNVIALYNSKYNGGYKFISQQWYKNGQPLEGETGTYIHLEDTKLSADDVYSVLLTREDGVALFTCDFTPEVKRPAQTMYRPKERIKLEMEDADAMIVNMSGRVMEHVLLSGEQVLSAPDEEGVYVLHVVSANGTIKRKIVVKQ